MDKEKLEDTLYDYYKETPSYVKTVIDKIPEGSISMEKISIIKYLYNKYLSELDAKKIEEIIETSRLFSAKLDNISPKSVSLQVEYIYRTFLDALVFNPYNRGLTFQVMNECVKVFSGYYDKYNIANESCVQLSSNVGKIRG